MAGAGTSILAVVAEIMARRADPLPTVAEAVRADQDADRVSIVTFGADRFTIVAHAGWGLLARDATLPVSTSTHFTTTADGRPYLADDFGVYIDRAVEWNESGRSHVVRYEDLHKDTFGVMKALTERIKPVDDETLRNAIETCKADNMRKLSPKMAQHIRSAKVGDSRERLSDVHFAIFRERYAGQLERLGYEIR